jgi:hypothetical protein
MKRSIAVLFAVVLAAGFAHAQDKKPDAKKSAKAKSAIDWARKNRIWMHKK